MNANRELFHQQRHPRFGMSNPDRMRMAHWEWMVKEGHGPYHVRQLLGVEQDVEAGPDWCFDRMGATRTQLPDGRVVCVGGEHEDWYDPDFYIYNDVIILGPGDKIEIYGYPKEVFQQTDFHSATLVGGRIILIGCLGYPAERLPGVTPVYSLDLTTYRIERLRTQGEGPGWIFKHRVEFDPTREAIIIKGGETIERLDGEELIRINVEEYQFLPGDGRWERITDRQGWRQFLIGRRDKKWWFNSPRCLGDESFLPRRVPYTVLPEPDWRTCRIMVEGVSISLSDEDSELRILVEGELPDDVVRRLVEDIQANIEEAINQPCRVLEI